jgi:hypothetical protein
MSSLVKPTTQQSTYLLLAQEALSLMARMRLMRVAPQSPPQAMSATGNGRQVDCCVVGFTEDDIGFACTKFTA